MLDCGEGSLGAMVRRFGDGVAGRLLGLRVLWLSHVHADHHGGACSLLRARAEAIRAGGEAGELTIVGGGPVIDILSRLVRSLRESGHDCRARCDASPAPTVLGSLSLTSFAVRHCFRAIGVHVALGGTSSVVFSGDTVPCDAVARAAAGCTVLIHEATFSDDMAGDAERKRHSTVGGALRVAAKARPGVTVLTHFSQRYSHTASAAKLVDGTTGSCATGTVLMALDGMQLPVDSEACAALAPAVAGVYRVVTGRAGQAKFGTAGDE